MYRLRVLLASALLLSSLSVAALEKKPLSAYSRETWTTRNGLPHNQVNAVTQTPEGYLWFATWEGLVRYNGQDFRIFTPKNVPGLQDHGIRHVSTGANGRLIVATSRGGVSIMDQGVWRHIGKADGLAQNETMAAVEDSHGAIWVAQESKGLSRVEANGRVTVFGTRDGLPSEHMYAVTMDKNKAIWAGSSNGLVRIENGVIQRFGAADGLPAGTVYAIVEAPEGGLYIGTHHGLYLSRNGRFSLIKAGFPDEAVISLTVDRQSNLWIGTVNRGILRMGRRDLETLDAASGLPNNRVGSIFSDREGNLWAGTNAGLVRFADTPFVTLDNYNGLTDNYVRAVAQLGDGSIMIGTSRGLNRYADEKITAIEDSASLKDDAILSLAPAKDGGLWVGMYSTGLVHWKDGRILESVSTDSPLYGSQIRALHEDRQGNLWVGTSRGVYRKKGGELKRFGEAQGLPRDFTLSLFEAKSGRIWVGSANGLGYIDGDKAGSIDLAPYALSEDVFGFSEDPDGTLWISTDRAILRLRNGKIDSVGTPQGLPVATVFQIITDTYGNFWLTSNRGVIHVKRAEMEAAADGKTAQLNPVSFAEADGMGSAQCNGGAGPAALRAKDGSIWVATAKGLSVVQPDELARYQLPPPPVVIESVMVDDQLVVPAAGVLVLPSSTRKLEMFYVSLTFRTPEQIRYRYRLEGFDDKWINRDQLRNVQFTNLPPGSYTFRVSAAVRGGAWSENTASLKFKIQPKYYQRAWFAPLLFVLSALLLYGFFRMRVSRLEARETELSGIVEERTRALHEKNIELVTLNERISQQSEAFAVQARTDALTGLANRRSMDETLQNQFNAAVTADRPFCFGLLDVDHFKRVNDSFSHDVGDQALKRIAQAMQHVMGEQHHGLWRGSDLCARWGGEEFALVFPDQDLHSAREKCEMILRAIEDIDCSGFAPGLHLSASIGLTGRTGVSHHEKMVSKADENLYAAKHQGRNRVVAL
ncbi:MAG TPA: two-component regulator propeller domain-containing protein [Arenimonas sp.]|nr:two-component regulator propeller domain-containing protein [Arenimonas sp.]